MFVRWISQMLGALALPEAELVMPILLRLAKQYPQALIYPFNLSRETIEDSPVRPVQTMKYIEQLASLLRSPLIETVRRFNAQ